MAAPTTRGDRTCWQCEHPEGDYYAEVVRPAIERCRWTVQHVAPDRLRAGLACTVGLTEVSSAELVATGLASEPSVRLLDDVAAGLQERPGAHGQRLSVDGRAVQLVSLPEWAKGFRGGRGGQPVLGPRDG